MKKLITLVMLFMSAIAIGQTVTIENQSYGSGTPGVNGYEKAIAVDNDYLHAPQYMAAFPTAATIWPRVVEVPCVKEAGVLKCQGYTWQPKMGRGEYLFFKPIIQEVQVPVPPQDGTFLTVTVVPATSRAAWPWMPAISRAD